MGIERFAHGQLGDLLRAQLRPAGRAGLAVAVGGPHHVRGQRRHQLLPPSGPHLSCPCSAPRLSGSSSSAVGPCSPCSATVSTCPVPARWSWSTPMISTPSPPRSAGAGSWSPPASCVPSTRPNAGSCSPTRLPTSNTATRGGCSPPNWPLPSTRCWVRPPAPPPTPWSGGRRRCRHRCCRSSSRSSPFWSIPSIHAPVGRRAMASSYESKPSAPKWEDVSDKLMFVSRAELVRLPHFGCR